MSRPLTAAVFNHGVLKPRIAQEHIIRLTRTERLHQHDEVRIVCSLPDPIRREECPEREVVTQIGDPTTSRRPGAGAEGLET